MGGTSKVSGSSASSSTEVEHLSAAQLERGWRFLGDASLAEGQVISRVTQVQRELQAGGFYSLRIDGDFGGGSQTAMRQFLQRFPLPAGTPNTTAAKLAWLDYVAANRFRTPDTTVRLTTSVPAESPSAMPAPGVVRVNTASRPDQALHEMPLFLRNAYGSDNSRYILGRLTYETGRAFDDNFDHTTGHAHYINQDFVDSHLALVAEAERRLPSLPLWSGPLSSPDQSEVAAIVARGYAQAARWYRSMELSNPADAARWHALAQQCAQKAVDVVAQYGRAPSDAPVVEPSGGAMSRFFPHGEYRFTGALARLPEELLSHCTFPRGSTRVPVGSLGHDQNAMIAGVRSELGATTGAPRTMPTAVSIRAALYPQRAASAEVRRVRDQLVRMHLALQTLERGTEDRVARAMYSKSYNELSEAQQREVLADSQHTRGYLLGRIETLEALENKLAIGEALTTEERTRLTTTMREVTEACNRLERRRPDYAYVARIHRDEQ